MKNAGITALLTIAVLGTAAWAQDATTPTADVNQSGAPSTGTSAASVERSASSTESSAPGVRIVRLSQLTGQVKLDRNTGQGFETAFPNLPIAQGEKLQTGDGVAEVEFEDNSSIRLGPNTEVDFPDLGRSSSGATTSKVQLLKGTVYASLANTKANEFSLLAGKDTIVLAPESHIRLVMPDGSAAKLAVFKGEVQVVNSSGTSTVSKKKAVSFDPASDSSTLVATKEEQEPLDSWDKTEAQYHNFRSVPASYGGSPYAYGINDLMYYGSFANVGGCGVMWRPYLASIDWDPFGNGLWAWYPAAGYSWVSPYPWGWTPFHYGSWEYCPGGGWGWQPGGTWTSLRNYGSFRPPASSGGVTSRPRPPAPPIPGRPTVLLVNTKPLSISKFASEDSYEFRKNSAGLGVPRGAFGNLGKISAGVEQHGTVVKQVSVPSQSVVSGGRPSSVATSNSGHSGSVAGGGLHSAPAPAAASTHVSAPAPSSSGAHH